MSADLYSMGYHNIVNVDYSATVIEKMASKHLSLTGERRYTYCIVAAGRQKCYFFVRNDMANNGHVQSDISGMFFWLRIGEVHIWGVIREGERPLEYVRGNTG